MVESPVHDSDDYFPPTEDSFIKSGDGVTVVGPLIDSGISANTALSDSAFQLPLPKSATQDSVIQSSWPSTDQEEANLFQSQSFEHEIHETTVEPTSSSISEVAPPDSSPVDSLSQPDAQHSDIDIVASDEFSHRDVLGTPSVVEEIDEPKLETETKIEVLPDGTVVTRKITKTTRKRVVAKSVLTKSEDGDVSVKMSDESSDEVKAFLKLQTTEDVGTFKSDFVHSTSAQTSTEQFLNLGKKVASELQSEHTDDLPSETAVDRTISVLHTQTTCIEGEDDDQADPAHAENP